MLWICCRRPQQTADLSVRRGHLWALDTIGRRPSTSPTTPSDDHTEDQPIDVVTERERLPELFKAVFDRLRTATEKLFGKVQAEQESGLESVEGWLFLEELSVTSFRSSTFVL